MELLKWRMKLCLAEEIQIHDPSADGNQCMSFLLFCEWFYEEYVFRRFSDRAGVGGFVEV